MHSLVLHNDEIRSASATCISPGQVGYMTGSGVFSTLRVSRGVLFAYERHWARMKRDAELLRIPLPSDAGWIERQLLRLVEANRAFESTLRVNIVRNKGGLFEGAGLKREFDVVAFTTDLKNWSDGVRLGVIPQARHAASRYAGTKITSWLLNLTMYDEAQARGYDEVVLLNERNEVSECTSANIFSVAGDEVSTPPLNSGCLAGITREILLSEIRVPGLRFSERMLTLRDLEIADQVFITSSTRDLLTVASIEGIRINQRGSACQRLRDAFREYIEDYVGAKAVA